MKRCTLTRSLLSAHATAWPALKVFAQGSQSTKKVQPGSAHIPACVSPRLRAGYVIDPARGDTGGCCYHDSIVVDNHERPATPGKQLGWPVEPGSI